MIISRLVTLFYCWFYMISTPVALAFAPVEDGTGEISGKVLDAETGEELIGATVVIKGTQNGSITGLSGDFYLSGVEEGNQTLVVSFVGYATSEIAVKIQQGILVNVTVQLQSSTTQLDEIVVVAKADIRYSPIRNSTDIQLVNAIKYSEGIITGISNEQIIKSVDRDASQIAQRISGVSLVDRFVVIRGLDTRYNLTLINGIVAPSSEDNSRAFSYDALPTGVIDRMELEKSPAPHLPAMWGGGIMKIYTRNFAKARQININVSGAARTEGSSFTNNFVTYNGSSKDWMANGAGDRRLPALLRQPYFQYPNINDYPLENLSIARSNSFRTFTPTQDTHDFDKRANISYYDSWQIGKLSLNNLTAASYTQERFFWDLDRAFNAGVYSQVNNNPDSDTLVNGEGQQFFLERPDLIGTDSIHEEQIRISAVQSLGLLFNDDHNVSVTLFYNRFGTDRVLNRTSVDLNTQEDEIAKNFLFRYEQRDIIVGQLGGSHRLNDKHSIDWTVGSSITRNDIPDLQRFLFVQNIEDDSAGFWSVRVGRGTGDDTFQSHYVFETEERSLTGRLDYRLDLSSQVYLRAGVFYDRKEREFFSQRYAIFSTQDPNSVDYGPVYRPWLKLDSIYAAENFDLDQLYLANPQGQGAYFFDDESREAYASMSYPLIPDRLSFYGGVRYARFKRVLYDQFNLPTESTTRFAGRIVTVPDQDVTYLLPSANLKYNFMDGDLAIRLAYGQSVDRPQFREQAGASSLDPNGESFSFYDFENNEDFTGNPTIENSLIHHGDLRLEFFPRSGEFMSIGGFYKFIDKPIQRFVESPGDDGSPDVFYANAREAEIFGMELEVRKKFDFLKNPVLRNMSINLNASYIISEARYSLSDIYSLPGVSDDLETIRLQGTSPYLLNGALYYESIRSGTLLSVIYNLTWDRIREYNAGPNIGDLVEGRRGQLDLVFKQRISDLLTVKAGAQNVLNQRIYFYRDLDNNYVFDPDLSSIRFEGQNGGNVRRDYEEVAYRPGAYYSLGFSFTIN